MVMIHSCFSWQNEKMGVYRLDRSRRGAEGSLVYRHCRDDVFLYFYRSPTGWTGWMAGPVPGTGCVCWCNIYV